MLMVHERTALRGYCVCACSRSFAWIIRSVC